MEQAPAQGRRGMMTSTPTLRRMLLLTAAAVILAASLAMPGRAVAQADDPTGRPYDQKLYRLSELLGAVHYLRELCGAKDGQRWRASMQELIDAEGTSAVRRATLARRFNRGYRGYSRTYRSCTASAQATIERFIKEAIEISDGLVKLAQ